MSLRRLLALGGCLLVLTAGLPVSAGVLRPGETERITLTPAGAQASGRSQSPSVSADGRFVAFASRASNLMEDAVGPIRQHIYVHDRRTGATEMVSVSSEGEPGNLDSQDPSITPDGRYVVFASSARSLTPTNAGNTNVYLHDRDTRTTELVSVTLDGTYNFGALAPTVSNDGRYVAFASSRPNLVDIPMSAGLNRVYLRDRVEETTELVPRTPDGTPVTATSLAPALSGDGRYIAFRSSSPDLVENTTNGVADIFVFNRETQVTERVSVAGDGSEGNGHSGTPVLSPDGRFVAFSSDATNLVPSDANGARDAFVHDRQTGETELVSVTSTGRQHTTETLDTVLDISADGRLVAFMVAGLGDAATRQIYVHDRATRATERVSVTAEGEPGNDDSRHPAISADGTTVVFSSDADDLVPGDTNRLADIFLRERGPATGVAGLSASMDGNDVRMTGSVVLSGALLASVDGQGGTEAARLLGADLHGVDLIWQAEANQLLVAWQVDDLRPLIEASGAGSPAIVYGLTFRLDGDAFEVRAGRNAGGESLGLYRCELTCELEAPLEGGIGTTGPWVTAGLPLALLEADTGAALTDLRAFTAVGAQGLAPGAEIAAVSVPDLAIPAVSLAAAVGQASAAPTELEFTPVAAGAQARLDALVPAPSGEELTAWVRTCIDEVCTFTSASVSIPVPSPTPSPVPETTEIAFTERSHTSGRFSDETLFEARLDDSGGDPIAGAELTFELTGSGSSRHLAATTDQDGIASVTPTLTERPGPYQLTVRFAGDEAHEPAADTTTFVVEKRDTVLELMVEGRGSERTLKAQLSDHHDPSVGIAGRTIDFYADGEFIGSEVTDSDGVATFAVPPGHRGANRTYEAIFEGDDFYRPASDRAPK